MSSFKKTSLSYDLVHMREIQDLHQEDNQDKIWITERRTAKDDIYCWCLDDTRVGK